MKLVFYILQKKNTIIFVLSSKNELYVCIIKKDNLQTTKIIETICKIEHT